MVPGIWEMHPRWQCAAQDQFGAPELSTETILDHTFCQNWRLRSGRVQTVPKAGRSTNRRQRPSVGLDPTAAAALRGRSTGRARACYHACFVRRSIWTQP